MLNYLGVHQYLILLKWFSDLHLSLAIELDWGYFPHPFFLLAGYLKINAFTWNHVPREENNDNNAQVSSIPLINVKGKWCSLHYSYYAPFLHYLGLLPSNCMN